MLILGVETSSTQVSCALASHDGVLAAAQVSRGQRHAELLCPMIEQVCASAGVRFDELAALAVGVGPGLFTGLRVGLATAKAMALALRLPMIGVSSLDLLAFPVRFTSKTIVTALDARRGEIFSAVYRPTPGGLQRLAGPQVGSAAELSSEIDARGEDTLLVGDGALRYRDAFAGRGIEVADAALAHPSAWALVQLAHAQALREEFVTPEDIHPVYLRKPDAEANWVQRPAPAGGAS